MRAMAIISLLFICACAIAAPATTRSAADLLAPTRVTLKLDHTPVVDALRSLFKQAGISGDNVLNDGFAQQTADLTVTADLVDQPYMVALIEICRQAYLEPHFSPQPGRLLTLAIRRPRIPTSPRPRPATQSSTTRSSMRGVVFRTQPRTGPRAGTTQPSWVDAPMIPSGPLVFSVFSGHRFSRVNPDGDMDPSEPMRFLELTLLVFRDPKLRLLALGDRVVVDEASDDAGASLMPDQFATRPDGAALRPIAGRDINHSELRAMLKYAERSSTAHVIAHVRGHVDATVVSRTQPVDLAKDGAAVKPGVEQNVGDVRFTVNQFQPFGGGGGWQLMMNVPYNSGDGQSHGEEVRALCGSDLLHVTDADGNSNFTASASVNSFHGDTGEYGVAITIHPWHDGRNAPPAKPPTHVVWDVPVEVNDVSIPIELKNLPLP